jgi:ADP-ribose pyrophosphatase
LRFKCLKSREAANDPLTFLAEVSPMVNAKVNAVVPIHEGRVFTLQKENITLPNGVTLNIDIIRHPGASAIVPISDAGEVILIRQYRHAVGVFIWEIPAGTLNKGETPLACARRELVEETGFSAQVFAELGQIVPVPGYSDERIHLFLAKGLGLAKQNLDSDELLDVHHVPLNEAIEMIKRGEIVDGKTIAGLLLAEMKRT